MMIQAKLKLRHHGCYSEAVTDGARVVHVSGDSTHCLAVMFATEPRQIDAFLGAAAAADVVSADDVIDRTPSTAIVHCRCPTKEAGVISNVLAAGAAIVWPVVMADGHEHLTLIVRDRAHLQRVVADVSPLADVTLERVHDIGAAAVDVHVPLAHITSDLTKRQLDALRIAIDGGYYDTPRRHSLAALASDFGVSPSTFHEHLRKAERAVMNAFAREVSTHPALIASAMKKVGRPPVRREHA